MATLRCSSLDWQHMDSRSVRSHLHSQRHFHETDGFISQLASESLSPVLCWEFSEAWYIDWLIFYPILVWRSTYVCEKIVLRRSSRRAITFHVKYVKVIMFANISGRGQLPGLVVCPFLVAAMCVIELNINYQRSRLAYRRKIHSTQRHSSSLLQKYSIRLHVKTGE